MWKTVVLFLTLTYPAIAQDDLIVKFNKYENEKKDKAVATLSWAILPGGGHFYAEDGSGAIYLLATIGAIGIGLAETSDGQEPLLGLITLIGVRLYDLISSFESVDDYNAELRSRLGIGVTPSTSSLTIRLTFTL